MSEPEKEKDFRLTVTVTPELNQIVGEDAGKEKRSKSQQIAWIVEQYYKHQLVVKEEVAKA